MPLVVKNVSPVRWRQPVYCTSTVSPRWTRAPLFVAASILYANPEDVFIASFGRVLMSSGGMTCGITRLAECADASDSSSGSLESPWHADMMPAALLTGMRRTVHTRHSHATSVILTAMASLIRFVGCLLYTS